MLGPERGDDPEGQEQGRERLQGLRNPQHRTVEQAPAQRRESADRHSDDDRQGRCSETDGEVEPGSVHHAGEDVHAELVCPEPEVARGRCKLRPGAQLERVADEERPDQRHQHEQEERQECRCAQPLRGEPARILPALGALDLSGDSGHVRVRGSITK